MKFRECEYLLVVVCTITVLCSSVTIWISRISFTKCDEGRKELTEGTGTMRNFIVVNKKDEGRAKTEEVEDK